MRRRRASWVLTATLAAGCAGRPAAPPFTTIVLGPDPIASEVRERVRATALPVPVAAAMHEDRFGDALARARKAYVNADFPACRTALAAIDPMAVLAADGRTLAARVLMWRVACHVGEGNREAARREATAFAAAGLDVPGDIAVVTPDVEAQLADAAAQAAKARPLAVRVSATPVPARIAVDGAAETCVTPCTVMLAPGAHAIAARADGFETAVRTVQAPGDREVAVALAEAAPPVVATQLQLRIARGVPIDDPGTLVLAAQAVRARNVVVVGIDPQRAGVQRLVGAFYRDGRVGARAERSAAPANAATRAASLVDELVASSAPVVPLRRRPLFWISVGGAAALAAGITGYALFRPDPSSRIVFP